MEGLKGVGRRERRTRRNRLDRYEKENRSVDHILWLWTLQLINMSLFFMLKKGQPKILTYVVEFIKRFQSRITMILSYKFGD